MCTHIFILKKLKKKKLFSPKHTILFSKEPTQLNHVLSTNNTIHIQISFMRQHNQKAFNSVSSKLLKLNKYF